MDYNREARIIPLPIGAVVSVGKNKIANTGKPANYDVPLRKEHMNQPARAFFYSYDGLIWYWSKFDKDDLRLLREQGVQVMRDNWWNRLKLS